MVDTEWPYDAYRLKYRIVIGDYYMFDEETNQAVTGAFSIDRNRKDWGSKHCDEKNSKQTVY